MCFLLKKRNKKIKNNKKGYAISPITILYKKVRRAFFSLFFINKKSGSMAVEAALVMPLFMFAMLNLNSLMDLYDLSIKNSFKVYEEVRVATAGANFLAQADISFDKDVTLFELYEGKPAIGILGYKNIPLVSIFTAKPWNGYHIDEKKLEEDVDTVFVTPTGDAYHSTDNCPYLKLSLEMVGRAEAHDRRNADGEKYKPCKSCGGGMGDSVFITEYGNQYHTSLECSALKRTIIEVSADDTGGRHACPKCH